MNIGIIGVGKLGLVYALVFERAGATVYASSYKQEYVENLQQRITDTIEPNVAEYLRDAKNITFTTDNHEVIRNCDFIYVMTATPSTDQGDYDISAVHQVVDDFKNFSGDLSKKILVVGCTMNPGNCADIQKEVEHLGVEVVYCPTLAAQGTVIRDVNNPPGILFGTDNPTVFERCVEVFNLINDPDVYKLQVPTTTAEILKVAMNCYSTLRISFFNQVGQVLIQSGLADDIKHANQFLNMIDSNKGSLRFGFGFGGPCYPRDNRSFSVYAEKLGNPYEFGPMVDRFNHQHSIFIADWIKKNNVEKLPFYFEYITYKPGVTLMDESQQYNTCCELLKSGFKVYIAPSKFLPKDAAEELQRQYNDLVEFVSLEDLNTQGIKVYHVNF
jgi:UDPglucose 6-dehydrogenase